MKALMSEFDIFYISFDEPKKEEFWAKLLDVAPWAKRIDGVKGFDSAHKAAANQSETERFITVDGDNVIFPEFLELEIDIPEKYEDHVLSWNAENEINSLCYGNGGLKLWTKSFVQQMKTHENAESESEKLDFCWKDKYLQLSAVYSKTFPNGSPFQAFRAGFREGVKMTLDRGEKLDTSVMKSKIYAQNLKRLLIWASVGADVENGLWSIYGTRLGIFEANLNPNFIMSNISDYEWFKEYFKNSVVSKLVTEEQLLNESTKIKNDLKKGLNLAIADLNAEQSKFFKSAMSFTPRTGRNLDLLSMVE